MMSGVYPFLLGFLIGVSLGYGLGLFIDKIDRGIKDARR
jgi:ABC-type lipoprotein release transport system permease subunit